MATNSLVFEGIREHGGARPARPGHPSLPEKASHQLPSRPVGVEMDDAAPAAFADWVGVPGGRLTTARTIEFAGVIMSVQGVRIGLPVSLIICGIAACATGRSAYE